MRRLMPLVGMAAAEPERWFIVDARLPKKKIEQAIWEVVLEQLQKKNAG